jgi:hypothetical protein
MTGPTGWHYGAAALAAVAAALAITGALPYAGSWNDGSRFAAAESLVDHRQWSIDRSVFVEPWTLPAGAPPPYAENRPWLRQRGTLDRLMIDGRFYSDKTPVPNLLLASEYALLQAVTGVTAGAASDRFCYWLTVGTSGIGYVAAVIGVLLFTRRILGPSWQALAVAASFSIATCAVVYSRQVNAHVLLLGVTAWIMERLDRQASGTAEDRAGPGFGLGLLAGAAYAIDAALGPLTAAFATGTSTLLKGRVAWPVVAGALPGIALHHALNYHIGGVIMPVNMVRDYLLWPGSPFTADTMTGTLPPRSASQTALYAVGMLIGVRGFLTYNIPALLVPLSVMRIRASRATRPERLLAASSLALVAAGWLVYAVGSATASGQALSVRWFLPWLAPLYYIIALGLREARRDWIAFGGLTLAGAGVAASAWPGGPWEVRVPLMRLWALAALITLAATALREWRKLRAGGDDGDVRARRAPSTPPGPGSAPG